MATTAKTPPATPLSAAKAQSLTNYLIIATLITLLIVVASALISKGLISQFLQNQRLLSKKQAAQHKLEADLTAITSLKQQYDQLPPVKVAEIQNALPDNPDFPSLSGMMELITGISGAKMKDISTLGQSSSTATTSASNSKSSASAPPTPYGLNIDVTTSYAGLQVLFQNMEISARPLSVTNITFSGTTPDMTASIGFNTYYQVPMDVSAFDKTESFK